ncbi:MAG: NAD(P)H-hydrate dehydratase [Spirochaetales bacterium]|nr:NAD(P)H-hydrate dehydratase [Spirochaetales bacterium]
MKVSSVEQMRKLDQRAVRDYGIPEEILMENAGIAAHTVLLEETGIVEKRFAVICATGNNGGDGLVVARKLHSMGSAVRVYIAFDMKGFKGASAINFNILSQTDVPLVQCPEAAMLAEELADADVIVDALFGTGLTRNIGGRYLDIVRAINTCGKPILSLDIPSGVNGDTGNIMGEAVKADYTVTFGLPKIGNIRFPGFHHCGKLFVSHISFPPPLTRTPEIETEISVPLPLPERDENGHKGTFGDVLFIAGAASYYGAPGFASRSFLKAGGGYARLAAPASMVPHIAQAAPEVVFIPMEETDAKSIGAGNLERLLRCAAASDMVVIGPGLSLHPETAGLVRSLAEMIEVPLLVDGDGLTALAADPSIVEKRKAHTVLTPHPGEMAAISGKTVGEVLSDGVSVCRDTARKLSSYIVLKGAHSLIGAPDGRVRINMSGNSGMGTAGSGDVLTGTIAAAYTLGLPVSEAVAAGVFIHGLSGDLSAGKKGKDGITAADICDTLPAAVNRYRMEYGALMRDHYKKIYLL